SCTIVLEPRICSRDGREISSRSLRSWPGLGAWRAVARHAWKNHRDQMTVLPASPRRTSGRDHALPLDAKADVRRPNRMTVGDRSHGLVPSTRWRAMLARSRDPRRRLDLVVDHPHAAALVPLIPVEDFYYLVRSVGLPDAHEVLLLASAEQLQGCLDLDL